MARLEVGGLLLVDDDQRTTSTIRADPVERRVQKTGIGRTTAAVTELAMGNTHGQGTAVRPPPPVASVIGVKSRRRTSLIGCDQASIGGHQLTSAAPRSRAGIRGPALSQDDAHVYEDVQVNPGVVGPPKITPVSGVLSTGKVVIRPIAFKPLVSAAGGVGVGTERSSSMPSVNAAVSPNFSSKCTSSTGPLPSIAVKEPVAPSSSSSRTLSLIHI